MGLLLVVVVVVVLVVVGVLVVVVVVVVIVVVVMIVVIVMIVLVLQSYLICLNCEAPGCLTVIRFVGQHFLCDFPQLRDSILPQEPSLYLLAGLLLYLRHVPGLSVDLVRSLGDRLLADLTSDHLPDCLPLLHALSSHLGQIVGQLLLVRELAPLAVDSGLQVSSEHLLVSGQLVLLPVTAVSRYLVP